MTVIILSGIRGSGKTTLAHQLIEERPGSDVFDICSIDDFFINGQEMEYHFRSEYLDAAKRWCLRRFMTLCGARPLVIVDNCNLTIEDISPYYHLAHALGEKIQICTRYESLQVAHQRNIHGATVDEIWQQSQQLNQRIFPSDWKCEITSTLYQS